jgi:putative ABC transport system permease protein
MATASLGALARVARRDALRHRSHSLLVVAMIALPVAGLVAGGTLLDTIGRHSGSLRVQMFGSLVVVLFWTVYAITLVAAVLMIGAAATIAARRQLRALGLLAATGARGRQLGAVVVLQAATLGLAGVLVGIPAGLLLARALLPRLARAVYLEPIYQAGPLLVAPGRLLLAGALGLLAATTAALAPAIRAARVPVTEALAARRPPPQQPRWLTIVGIVLVLAGLGLAGLQIRLLGRPWLVWVALASLAAVLVGVAALSPALVALLGRTAGRLPATLRLAVRDLARHPTRSAAAVAAVTAGLAVPMLIGVQAAQSAAYLRAYAPRELRADQVVANSPAAVAAVTTLLPGARQAPFTTAHDAAGNEVTVHGPVIDQPDIGVSRGLAIGEQGLLVAMGGEQAAAAFARGVVVAFGPGLVRDGQVSLAVTGDSRLLRRITMPAVQVTTAAYMGETLPSFVISRQTAERLALPGLATPPRYLVRAARPLSDAQRDQLRGLQTRLPAISISWAEPDPDQQLQEQGTRSILLGLLAVVGMIALGSVAAACALALSEAREDLTTLAQVGAAPAMTQRLMMAEAWLLAGLGALLAVFIGLAPAAVWTLATGHLRPSVPIPVGPLPFAVPWTLLAVVILAIPALAAAAASLLGRSPAPLTPRRGGLPQWPTASHWSG